MAIKYFWDEPKAPAPAPKKKSPPSLEQIAREMGFGPPKKAEDGRTKSKKK